MRAPLALLALAVIAGCTTVPTIQAGPPIVEDATVRTYLDGMTLEDEALCRLSHAGGAATAWCRVYRGLGGERVIGAYDRVSGVLAVLLLVQDDGHQVTLWIRGNAPLRPRVARVREL